MYKKKELFIIGFFIIITILLMYFSKDKEEPINDYEISPIEIVIDGEIIRKTTLYYYRPTTYGVVLRKIANLKNEYSDFSKFDYQEKIIENTLITIPTLDINNKYSPNHNNKICINTATKEELKTLYQIGDKRADKILSYIANQKRISSWEKFKEITSVSDETIKRIKKQAFL